MGAGTIALILAIGRGVPAWQASVTKHRAIAAQLETQRVEAHRALLRRASVQSSLAARLQQLGVMSGTLVPGTDDGAATRALAAMISGAALGAEVRLSSTLAVTTDRASARLAMGEQSARPLRKADSATLLHSVAVRIIGTADIRGVTTLLEALERGPTRLRVRSLTIMQPDVTAGDELAESLQIDLVVEGLAVAHPDTSLRSTPARPPTGVR